MNVHGGEPLSGDLLAAIGDVAFELTPAGVHLRFLGGPRDLLPRAPDAHLGRELHEVYPGDVAADAAAALARLRAGARLEVLELALPLDGGATRYFEMRLVPAANGNVLALVRDVDAHKRTQLHLVESEARFRIMADGAPVMLWVAGLDGLCTFFNRRWLEFSGRPLERELGNGWAEGVHAEDFQRCMSVYLSAFVERRTFRMEYRLRRADGEYRWLLDQGLPRFDAGGSFVGYVGSCIDITDMKEAHGELVRLTTELEDRVRLRTAELESFAYSVSHDLRQPLRAMHGFSQALLEDAAPQLDTRAQRHLQRIQSAADRMGQMIDGLLKLSRLGRADLHRRPVDLTAMAERIINQLREAEPERHVRFIAAPSLPADADPVLVQTALENLLGNAWKFTSRVGEAEIELGQSRQLDERREFFVRDNGAGFDMAYADKLFGPFQRLHGATEFPGTGIGLATVQRIVQRHGGRIWAESTVGGGATFRFTL